MDDEQGPWWTRPPEPGPQARAGEQWNNHPSTEVPDDDAPQPQPAPEPDPFAPPKPPVIRRVAVLPPPAPSTPAADPGYGPGVSQEHGRAYSGSRTTANLPAVGDDIFAVFGATELGRPGSGGGPAGPGRVDDPLAHLREDAEHPHRRLPHVPHVPAGRMPLILAVAGLIGVVVLLVILIGPLSSGDQPTSVPASRTAATAPKKSGPAATLTGTPPSGLTQVSSSQAADLLRKAHQSPGGTIVQAWGWTDRNGQNLVVDSMTTVGSKQDLQVTQLAELNRSKPRVLRIMHDPGLPAGCRSGGYVGFTPNGTSVRDLNGDGIAEVAVGWSSRCGGSSSISEVKLALITNGSKYIIRGRGVIGHNGDGSIAPDPRPSSWPSNYLAQLKAIFHTLYF